MAKHKNFTVVSKIPRYGKGKRKDGHKVRLGTTVEYKDGRVETFLTPSGKGAKYAAELRSGQRRTNDGKLKVDSDGVVQELTDLQRVWRWGYLTSQKDSANAFKARAKVGSAAKSVPAKADKSKSRSK